MKIEVDNLIKQYGEHQIVKGISFQVEEGIIFAILGANGAGKTTILECIEGIRKYDSGNILVNGEIGVQLQCSALPEEIKTVEALQLFAKWNQCKVDTAVSNRLGITSFLKRQYTALSTGQKRRLHLALAMTGNPDILFLDEPTAGLDVEGRVALHEEMRRLKKEGKTIILASHDMAEVESLCDQLIILKEGKVAFKGTVEALKSQVEDTYKIQLKLSPNTIDLQQLKYCTYQGQQKGYYLLETTQIEAALREIFDFREEQQLTIHDLSVAHTSLEECFMDIAKGEVV